MIMEEVLGAIEDVISEYITQEKLSNISVLQAEYQPLFRNGGWVDEAYGDNYYKDVGWAANLNTSVSGSSGSRFAYLNTSTQGIDIGEQPPLMFVNLRVMVKKRPGADPNTPFGYLIVKPTWVLPPTYARIDLKPSMFPVDYKWYNISVPYTGGAFGTDLVWVTLNADFIDSSGAYTGIDFIKVDYVRFHK
jgi:hypothetical protein|nr:MAG: hypothetical protein C4536_02960 [Actinomycetota bacterium]